MQTERFIEAQKLRNSADPKAPDLYLEVRNEAISNEDLVSAAECSHMIGNCYFNTKDFDRADIYLQQALEEFMDLGESRYVGMVLRDLGMNARSNGKLIEAGDYLVGSLKTFSKSEDMDHAGMTRVKLGRVFADQRRFDEAMWYVDDGIKVITIHGKEYGLNQFFLASGLLDRAKVNLQMGNKEQALKDAQNAEGILDLIGKDDQYTAMKDNIKKVVSAAKV